MFASDFRDLHSDRYTVRQAAQRRLLQHAPLVEPVLRFSLKDPETRRFVHRLSRLTSCPASLAVLHPQVTFEIHGTWNGPERRYHNVHSTTLQTDRAWLQRRMPAGPDWEVLYYSVSDYSNSPRDLFAWIIHVYHLRARATRRCVSHTWTYWYRPDESQLACTGVDALAPLLGNAALNAPAPTCGKKMCDCGCKDGEVCRCAALVCPCCKKPATAARQQNTGQ